ncbi:hypothetical protein ACHAXR_005078 [Thalassiosira sp. AJA248-18]
MRSLLSTLLMCAEKDKTSGVSKSVIGRTLLGSYSNKTHERMIEKAGIKRKRFYEQDLGQFCIIDKEKKRWKYTDEDIEGLRGYMVDNTYYTRESPMKDDTVVKKDCNGDAVLKSNGEKLEIQKVLITVCPRQLHVHMMEEVTKGGYKYARDRSGEVKFSITTIVSYWPNWLTIMKDGHMMLCGCKTCTEMDGLHEAMQLKRRKIISETDRKLMEMEDGQEKEKLRKRSEQIQGRNPEE